MASNKVSTEIRRAWTDSPPLVATALFMLAVLGGCLAGLALDTRIISGAPAWLKPAKFAISTAIFCGSLAWLYRYITVWPRFLRAMGWVISAVLTLEVAIIGLQAARGTTSHFNVRTLLDGALWSTMGIAIAVLWMASVGIMVALFRQRFEKPAWGWWLRLGMLVSVLGSAAGGMMVTPTSEQAAAMRAGERARIVGAHTVGAPDGGPGLPVLGWSRDHGDLRVPHFLGLHGLQVLPLLGWLAMGRWGASGGRRQVRLAFAAAASYVAPIAILAGQALAGRSIVAPDLLTLAALGAWLLLTLGTVLFVLGRGTPGKLSSSLSRSTT